MSRISKDTRLLTGWVHRFQDADHALRTYAVVSQLGWQKEKISDDVFDALERLEQFVANAKEGQFLRLQAVSLTRSEHEPFFRYGTRLLDGTQPITHTVLEQWEQVFVSENKIAEQKLLVPDEQYQAFMLLYLSLCYLSRLETITYKQLTRKDDVRVTDRMEKEKSFWQINLTPEHIIGRLRRIHAAILEVSVAPQLIFSSRTGLELCHFIGLVSKVGTIAITEESTRSNR